VGDEPYPLQPAPTNQTSILAGKCATYQSGVHISVVRGDSGRRPLLPPPHQPIYTVSLVFLEPFQELVENPSDAKAADFELNSHLVTITLEVAEDAGKAVVTTDEAIDHPLNEANAASTRYQPADTLALDGSFLFSLEFAFLNGSFNRTERRVACGEVVVPPTAASFSQSAGGGDRAELWSQIVPSPHCRLTYANLTHRPRCICNRSGTYGLIVPSLQRWEDGVPVHGVSKVGTYRYLQLLGDVIFFQLSFSKIGRNFISQAKMK
jgi:hypothetical protein